MDMVQLETPQKEVQTKWLHICSGVKIICFKLNFFKFHIDQYVYLPQKNRKYYDRDFKCFFFTLWVLNIISLPELTCPK